MRRPIDTTYKTKRFSHEMHRLDDEIDGTWLEIAVSDYKCSSYQEAIEYFYSDELNSLDSVDKKIISRFGANFDVCMNQLDAKLLEDFLMDSASSGKYIYDIEIPIDFDFEQMGIGDNIDPKDIDKILRTSVDKATALSAMRHINEAIAFTTKQPSKLSIGERLSDIDEYKQFLMDSGYKPKYVSAKVEADSKDGEIAFDWRRTPEAENRKNDINKAIIFNCSHDEALLRMKEFELSGRLVYDISKPCVVKRKYLTDEQYNDVSYKCECIFQRFNMYERDYYDVRMEKLKDKKPNFNKNTIGKTLEKITEFKYKEIEKKEFALQLEGSIEEEEQRRRERLDYMVEQKYKKQSADIPDCTGEDVDYTDNDCSYE